MTLYKRGGVWGIQYRIGGKQVRESLRTTNRKVAEEIKLHRELEVGRQRLGLAPLLGEVVAVKEEPAAPDLAKVRAEYVAWSGAHKRPKTILNDTARLDSFFATVPGKSLGEVRTADVERYLTAEAKRGMSPATLLRNREILHAFWRWAVRQDHAERNIVSEIPRPRLPERDPVFLNLEQIDELLKAVAGTVVEAPIATAVFTGLRREELCWLTWDDLELDRVPAILRVRAKTVGDESWQPKTKRDRKVPVSARLLEVLQHKENGGRRPGVSWLFPSLKGCRWDPDNLSREFLAVLESKKLPRICSNSGTAHLRFAVGAKGGVAAEDRAADGQLALHGEQALHQPDARGDGRRRRVLNRAHDRRCLLDVSGQGDWRGVRGNAVGGLDADRGTGRNEDAARHVHGRLSVPGRSVVPAVEDWVAVHGDENSLVDAPNHDVGEDEVQRGSPESYRGGVSAGCGGEPTEEAVGAGDLVVNGATEGRDGEGTSEGAESGREDEVLHGSPFVLVAGSVAVHGVDRAVLAAGGNLNLTHPAAETKRDRKVSVRLLKVLQKHKENGGRRPGVPWLFPSLWITCCNRLGKGHGVCCKTGKRGRV